MATFKYNLENSVLPPEAVALLEEWIGFTVFVSLTTSERYPMRFFYAGVFVGATAPVGRDYSLRCTRDGLTSITLNLRQMAEISAHEHVALGQQIWFQRTGQKFMNMTLSLIDPVEFMDNNFSVERGWEGEQIGAPKLSNVTIEIRPSTNS